MPVAGAALADDVDDAAHGAAVLGLEAGALDLDFLHELKGNVEAPDAPVPVPDPPPVMLVMFTPSKR